VRSCTEQAATEPASAAKMTIELMGFMAISSFDCYQQHRLSLDVPKA
jgi:hypothetical protein